MTNKVNFEFSATDSGLAREINKINATIDRLSSKMGGLQDRFNRGLGSLQNVGARAQLDLPIRQLAGIAAGAVSAQSILSKLVATGREFAEEGLEASKRWDAMFREFGGQSGLRGKMLDDATVRIRAIGQEVGLDLENTARAATQMVSSGFSAQEASGESLKEFLKGFVASNLAGQQIDMRDLTQATSSYLSAQQMEKNATNVRDVIQRVQTLYKTTNMQFTDFAEFARESASMGGILSVGEQLASFSTLRDVMTAEEAATGLRNVTQRMRTAGGTKEKTEGLKTLGLRPEDVDMIGEDFLTAMSRISEGLKTTAPELRPIALKKIFEERGVAIAEHLMKSLELVSQRIREQAEGVSQFEKDARFGAEGVNAATRRQESDRLALMAKTGQDRNLLMYSEARQYMIEKGYGAFRTDLNIGAAKLAGYINGASADENLTGLPLSDKEISIIQQRVNAKLQGTKITPEQIERNMNRPAAEPLPAGFGAGQVATWEEARKRFRNPNNAYRNTTLNPWYDMARRFPEESRAQREAARMEAEMSATIDAFGSLSPEESNRFRGSVNALQGRANKLDRNVHAYDLQVTMDKLAEALDRNTKATAGNTEATKTEGTGEKPVHRPTTIRQQRVPGGGAL